MNRHYQFVGEPPIFTLLLYQVNNTRAKTRLTNWKKNIKWLVTEAPDQLRLHSVETPNRVEHAQLLPPAPALLTNDSITRSQEKSLVAYTPLLATSTCRLISKQVFFLLFDSRSSCNRLLARRTCWPQCASPAAVAFTLRGYIEISLTPARPVGNLDRRNAVAAWAGRSLDFPRG